MDETMETSQSANAFTDKTISRLHKFYINREIKDCSEYVSWFETIRNATETDVVMFHINSYGGDLFTTIQFMRAMRESKATIVASVEGACMSAATLIFLSANHWEISDHSMFMFHNYISGTYGKGGEIYDCIVHERAWGEKLFNDVYSDFLTKQEIESLLNNKDIWMSSEEVTKRLELKAKKMKDKESPIEAEVLPKQVKKKTSTKKRVKRA